MGWVVRQVEENLEIDRFLPVLSERAYFSYLVEAFETNYANGIYQFAFLAYYMLMMRFISTKIWQITKAGVITVHPRAKMKRKIAEATSPIGIDPEDRQVIKLVKQLLPDNNSLQSLINLRNNVAHANGYIHISEQDILDGKIEQTLEIVKSLQDYSHDAIRNWYFNFLLDSRYPEEREFLNDDDQINEVLIRQNYLSSQDVVYCANSHIHLPDLENFDRMEALHGRLRELYPLDDE